MSEEIAPPFRVFYSYAHKDEKLRNELAKHLTPLKREKRIDDWFDRDVNIGKEWEKELATHLNTAHIILLLISADFIASDYCYGVEMKRALERHEAGEACVIPILLDTVDWQGTPFSKLQYLPRNAKAIKRWPNKSDAFAEVAKNIRETLKTLSSLLVSENSAPAIEQNNMPQEAMSGSSSLAASEQLPQETTSLPAWHMPHKRNPFFIGRDKTIEQIHTTFVNNEASNIFYPCVISGLGGMGKTQLAIEYAHRYREAYHTTLWARADSLNVLMNDLASFAGVLQLPVTKEHDQQYALDAVKRWLELHVHWLLILDNVEDLQAIQAFLPADPTGHILITSQIQVTGGTAFRFAIEKLSPEEAIQFLLHRIHKLPPGSDLSNVLPTEYAAALAIAQEMDGLPLAFDQAGAYIEETGCGLSGYLPLYQKQKEAFLSTRGGFLPTHPQSLMATWSLSFARVEQINAHATALLWLFAFLHPDAIFEDLLLKGTSQLFLPLQSILIDNSTLSEAIRVLYQYSLVRRSSEGMLTIHRLTQTVLKASMTREEQHLWAEAAVRIVCQAFPHVDFQTWPECQKYLPHIQICAEIIAQEQLLFSEAAHLLSEAGFYLYEQGQYGESEKLLLQSLHITEQSELSPYPDRARTHNRLANLYREQGNYLQAEEHYQFAEIIYNRGDPNDLDAAGNLSDTGVLFHIQAKFQQEELLNQQALSIREQVLGAQHPDTASSLNNLARLYHAQGLYGQAKPLYERALSIREQMLGARHPDTATSLNNLAFLHQAQGLYGQAKPLYERALSICEQVLGAQHPATATSLNSLAGLCQAQGLYGQAKPLYERALSVREQVLGTQHPDTATSLNSLAGLCQDQGLYGQAKPLYERALSIREQALGTQHPSTATSLNNLAALYQAQGLYGQAKPLYERALSIWEQVFGAQHPDTATSLNNLAALYQAQGLYDQTKPLYERALSIREQVLGIQHPSTATSLNNLALLYKAQGLYGQAKPLYERALSIREQVLGAQHPDTANSLNNLAGLYQAQGLYGQAKPLYERALSICERVLGALHPDTANSLNNLAGLYQAQGLYGQTKPLYERALSIQEQVLGSQHPDTATGLNNLALLYQAQGLYGQAKPLYERALSIREQVLGAQHPDTAASLNNLGTFYQEQKLYRIAEPFFRKAIVICQKFLGPAHPNTISTVKNYCLLLRRTKRKEQAVQLEKYLKTGQPVEV